MHSPDLTDENVAKIRELFPGCVIESKDENGDFRYAVDFDQLKQEMSDHIVEGTQERYHLNWPGKREALLTANAPIAKTLRPSRKESVNFDKTRNLLIEGDNLEALKLLQETYLGKVKMIYIDPPYNSGNDFVYKDDFSESSTEYFQKSNQVDEKGNRLIANPASKGRFHSDWLTLIYPRLRVARTLLKDDGLIFISIDDGELNNLVSLCNEVFGIDKHLATFVWKSRQNKDNRTVTGASIDHEYIVCYGSAIRGSERDKSQYSNPDNDPRGDWSSANMVGIATADRRPNLHYDLINPETGINYGCPDMGWRYEPNTMSQLISEGRILWPQDSTGRPRRKAFLNELESDFTGFSTIIGDGIFTRNGTADTSALFGARVFTFPKPVDLIKMLIQQGTDGNDIVLDFFAGSGTTAHSVLTQNAEDGENRQFILVQLPEQLDIEHRDQGTAAKFCDEIGKPRNIAELSKERIRRAGRQVEASECHEKWHKDIGFRVLKVDTSSMADVYYTPGEMKQDDLLAAVDNIKPGRDNPEDLLFQVLVDWGVDLTLPIRSESVQGKTVFFVNEEPYDLIACFDTGITEELVKELAKHEPMRIVFGDNGFVSDAVKINVDQVFRQLSPATDVKSI